MVMPRFPEWFGPSKVFSNGPRVADTTGTLYFNYVNTPLYAMLAACYTGWRGSIVWRVPGAARVNASLVHNGPGQISLGLARGATRSFYSPITATAAKITLTNDAYPQQGTISQIAYNGMFATNAGYDGTVYGLDGLPVEAVFPHYSAFKYHPGNPRADGDAAEGSTDISDDSIRFNIVNSSDGFNASTYPEYDFSLFTHAGVDFSCFGFMNIPTVYTIGTPAVAGFTPATTN